ncbi:MAG TPA: zinc ribbon domain-containing protein [Firmicutes bacterium]|nr:zinc ribbon domain-containing protein [Bacillota bacterium]
MPNYEYRCCDCGSQFELQAPISAKPQHPPCVHCQSTNTKAVFCVFAITGRGRDTGTSGGSGCSSCRGGNCSTCH